MRKNNLDEPFAKVPFLFTSENIVGRGIHMVGDAVEFGSNGFVGLRYPGFDELEKPESAMGSAFDLGLIMFKTPIHSGPFAVLSDATLQQDFQMQIDGSKLFVVEIRSPHQFVIALNNEMYSIYPFSL